MEAGIVDEIIQNTVNKLSGTDTSLNMLDILQSYDAYIKQHKLAIDMKTQVYKGILRWSRENLHDQSRSESALSSREDNHTLYRSNSDLEYDFRENFTEGSLNNYNDDLRDDNDIAYKKHHKKMKLPKLSFENVLYPQEVQS